jgi:hypothetical protein
VLASGVAAADVGVATPTLDRLISEGVLLTSLV